jgi:hypothetical protein
LFAGTAATALPGRNMGLNVTTGTNKDISATVVSFVIREYILVGTFIPEWALVSYGCRFFGSDFSNTLRSRAH